MYLNIINGERFSQNHPESLPWNNFFFEIDYYNVPLAETFCVDLTLTEIPQL